MAGLYFLLIFLGVVDYGMFQNLVTPAVEQGCSLKPGYIPGSAECCNSTIFASLFRVCCTDAQENVCYCDGNQFGTVCAAEPAASTPFPAAPNTLCPAPMIPASAQGRLLGGDPVTEGCSARGVVGLSAGGAQFCNAAYVHDLGTGQKVLYTLSSCWEGAVQTMDAGIPTEAVIFGDSFPLGNCTVETTVSTTSNANMTRLTLSKLAWYFVEQHLEDCPSPGCVYTPSTMRDAIDLNACYVVSYGFTAAGYSELKRVPVKMADVTQCSDAIAGSQCFVSTQGGAPCLGDGGAPVYCSLSTGEVALYGITSQPSGCSPWQTAFHVVPVSL